MDWKRIAPWNWFKEEEAGQPAHASAPSVHALDAWTASRVGFDRLVEEVRRELLGPSEPAPEVTSMLIRPRVDISESRKRYTVRVDLPGVEREDVSVTVDGSRLRIRAEKHQEREEEEERYHHVERSHGVVERVLTLPDDADPESVEARFESGVLTLRIAKHAVSASTARNVEIAGD